MVSGSAYREGRQETYPGREVTEAKISLSGIGVYGQGEGEKIDSRAKGEVKTEYLAMHGGSRYRGEQCRTRAGRAERGSTRRSLTACRVMRCMLSRFWAVGR